MVAGPLHNQPASSGDGHTLTGNIRRLEAFRSDVLDNTRDVLVYLPPGYDEDTPRRYPVLYLHDGQNIFDGATSYVRGQEWCVDESAEHLIRTGVLPPLIVVAIDHAGPRRAHEFAPSRDRQRDAGGGADDYGRFLVDELKAYVDSAFRTRADAASTGVGGSSLGGLVTLHLGLTRADVFGALMVMSPSLWWDRRGLLEQYAQLPARLPWRIWLDCGTGEGRDTIRNARALRTLLLQKGWVGGRDLRYVEARGASHEEAAWAGRVPQALPFLFPTA